MKDIQLLCTHVGQAVLELKLAQSLSPVLLIIATGSLHCH